MNDFFDSLKEIKKDLKKQESIKSKVKQKIAPKNENYIFKDEFDIEKESIKSRQKRLQNEFLSYMKDQGVKEI